MVQEDCVLVPRAMPSRCTRMKNTRFDAARSRRSMEVAGPAAVRNMTIG